MSACIQFVSDQRPSKDSLPCQPVSNLCPIRGPLGLASLSPSDTWQADMSIYLTTTYSSWPHPEVQQATCLSAPYPHSCRKLNSLPLLFGDWNQSSISTFCCCYKLSVLGGRFNNPICAAKNCQFLIRSTLKLDKTELISSQIYYPSKMCWVENLLFCSYTMNAEL